MALLPAWSLTIAGLVFLLIGGHATEHAAYKVATWWGWSEAVIGMTIVAIATSLPELATVIAASLKKHHDLAVGNVIGSNMFNILLVFGVTSIIGDVPLPGNQGWFDLGVMVFMTLLVLALVITRSHRVNRLEGGLLLLLYVVFLTVRASGVLAGLLPAE